MQKEIEEALARPATTVPMAGKILGLSRSHAYAEAKAGKIPTIKFGARWVVPTLALKKLLGMEPA
jgi:hypothetical protein